MNMNSTVQTLDKVEELYKATMAMYESYFEMLRVVVEKTPDSETEKLARIAALVDKANESLQADQDMFEKAISTDAEAITGLKDNLKIQNIYKKLQK